MYAVNIRFCGYRSAVIWVLDAFVWAKLIPDGDHAIATRVFDFLVEPHNA